MGKLVGDAAAAPLARRRRRGHARGPARVPLPDAGDRAGAGTGGGREARGGDRQAAPAATRSCPTGRPPGRDGLRAHPRARGRDRRRRRRRGSRVPHALERHARGRRHQRRRVGPGPRHVVVDTGDPARDGHRWDVVRDRARASHLRRRVRARAEPVDSRLPRDRARRRGRARQRDQGAPPPGPADVQPDRGDARPLLSERSLGDGRCVLRSRRARAGPATEPAHTVGAGRRRRSPSRSAWRPAACCSASIGSPT